MCLINFSPAFFLRPKTRQNSQEYIRVYGARDDTEVMRHSERKKLIRHNAQFCFFFPFCSGALSHGPLCSDSVKRYLHIYCSLSVINYWRRGVSGFSVSLFRILGHRLFGSTLVWGQSSSARSISKSIHFPAESAGKLTLFRATATTMAYQSIHDSEDSMITSEKFDLFVLFR